MKATSLSRSAEALSPKTKLIGLALFAALATSGLWLFAQSDQYHFWSLENLHDILEAKAVALLILLTAFVSLYAWREKSFAPALTVFFVSAYFVFLYGLMFQGTEFGMNAHWADNANRIAAINKMLLFKDPFQDWYTSGLSMFYPPLWFWLMALWAKIMQIDAVQTVKYGYLFVFLIYPWLLYFSWKPLVSRKLAAAITVTTIFFAHWLIDYTPYEHITAALFLPWWLRFVAQSPPNPLHSRVAYKHLALGIFFGAALALAYYWWFFLAIIGLAIEWITNPRDCGKLLSRRLIITLGIIIVTAVYWLPLIIQILTNGFESTQSLFFGMRHSNLTGQWEFLNWHGVFIIAGALAAGYTWNDTQTGKLKYLQIAGIVMILLDRAFNLSGQSIQTRKLLEFAPVLLAPSLVVAGFAIWNHAKASLRIQPALFALLVIISLVAYNEQTQMFLDPKYKTAVETRRPTQTVKALEAASVAGQVMLTNRYIEMCYVPYYTFITITNTSAHPAGRYSKRATFLELATKITEPDLLAYALRRNVYDAVDWIYLPRDKTSGAPFLTVSKYGFNLPKKTVTYSFAVRIQDYPKIFEPTTDAELFKIATLDTMANVSKVRSLLIQKYPTLKKHLLAVN